MSAPERIWAWVKMRTDGEISGSWVNSKWHPNSVEYVRADLWTTDERVRDLVDEATAALRGK